MWSHPPRGCSEGVHRFEARYDEVPTGYEPGLFCWGFVDETRSLMLRKVYVRDVCVRCGKTIERGGDHDPSA